MSQKKLFGIREEGKDGSYREITIHNLFIDLLVIKKEMDLNKFKALLISWYML
jgi:hypothetical protein